MNVFKWLLQYLKKNLALYSFGLFLVLITALINMINPLLSGKIVDTVIGDGVTNILVPILIVMLSSVILKALLTYSYQMIFEKVSQEVLLKVRHDLYNRLLKLDFNYYNNTKTGDIMARMTGDTDALRHFIAWVIYNSLLNGSIFVFAIVSMAFVNIYLTLFMFAICPIIGYVTIKLGKQIAPTFYNVREAYSSLNSVTQENISGNRVVKAFSRESHELDKFMHENINYRNKNLDSTSLIGKYMPILEYLSSSLSIVMIFVGGIFVIKGYMTLGD